MDTPVEDSPQPDDHYAYLMAQHRAIKARNLDAIDREFVADELENEIRSQQRDVSVLLEEMLYQLLHLSCGLIQRDGPRWQIWNYRAVDHLRQRICSFTRDDTTLRLYCIENYEDLYARARTKFQFVLKYEINPIYVPDVAPWSFETIMEDEFEPIQYPIM